MRLALFLALLLWAAIIGGASALIFPASGQPAPVDATMVRQCPAERPHRLEIETGTMACTSMQCLGRMDCGSGTCKITRDLGDSCNTCTMRTYVACLSENDLKAMRR